MSPIASALSDRAGEGQMLIAMNWLESGLLTRPKEVQQSKNGYFVFNHKNDYVLSLGLTYGDL